MKALLIVAYLLELSGNWPALGQCADAEVALFQDDSSPGVVQSQLAWTVCNLAGLPDPVVTVGLACGTDQACLRTYGNGYIGWVGPVYAATAQTWTSAQIDRSLVHGECAVQPTVDAGPGAPCQQWLPGADAGVRAPMLTTSAGAGTGLLGAMPATLYIGGRSTGGNIFNRNVKKACQANSPNVASACLNAVP
jgi:hypothetical protein